MFETTLQNRNEAPKIKALRCLRAYLGCTMPTLKSRLKNPKTFTIGEVLTCCKKTNFDLLGTL